MATPSVVDGVCDLPCGLDWRQVRGVDDLGRVVQPDSGCFGVGIDVLEAKGRGPEECVCLDACAEDVWVAWRTKCRTGMSWSLRLVLISRQYCSTRTVIGITRVPPV